MKTRHPHIIILLLSVLALGTLGACPFIGSHAVTLVALWGDQADPATRDIFFTLRLPRVFTAFLAGMALAGGGAAFQAMFRNPLATPFTLGTASGASLGAAVYMRLGLSLSLFGISGISLAAFLGALGAIVLVYSLTCLRRGFSPAYTLLAGVAVSMFFSSLILFMQYISDFTQSFRIMRWLMGGLTDADFESLFNLLPAVGIGILVLWLNLRELNLLGTGDDIAASRGVPVAQVKRRLFFATSFMIGAVVAFCGPIGFVGMMAPHICRRLVGGNHRWLLPASLLFGGSFLTLCDTLSRSLIDSAEIPVGVITALLGGPFFLWLLTRSKIRV
ncbi:MAG: iron ABC transporter permease [Lentisphaeria bacterium]|nr:iron ABC transporter permease [Lentisphaeria bacterium]